MAEVIRLAESHVDPGVILAYIQTSGQTYSPTADEILYLSHLGVPQNVIAALFPAQSAQPVATAEAIPAASLPETAPPQDTTTDVFTDALAPYGNWVQVPEYGAAWQPTVETTNPDWRPYVADGQWINSDSGWYWQSDYPWGWAPFHYGGWINADQLGWVWVPGKTWGPAWVAWRSAASYVGWAPLPPGVSLNVLAQLTFSGHPVSPDYDFGVSLSSYVFVRTSRFLNPDLPRHVVPAGRSAALAESSTVINNYSVVNNKIINGGVSRSVVAAAAKRPAGEGPLLPATSAPAPMESPALLASAHDQESAWPGMQLPPLRGAPPPAALGSRDSMRRFRPGASDRPAYGGPEAYPTSREARSAEVNRSASPAPVRNAASGASSGGKSTK
jgi:hypothetical protein